MYRDFFKLAIPIDLNSLLRDFNRITSKNWLNHFVQEHYSGNWQCIALRSVNGRQNNIYANPQQSGYMNTELLNKLPAFLKLLSTFNCETESIRLMKLDAGSSIKTHRDHDLSYKFDIFRLHIPIISNKKVWFTINGKRYQMDCGNCYYGDFSKEHSVVNDGSSDRIHLVIDCKRNNWTDDLFMSSGYDINEKENEARAFSKDELLEIIRNLEEMDNDISKELIKKYREELSLRP